MAIAITPDGKRAVVACFGSGSLTTEDGELAVIDIAQKTVVDRVAAGLFPEEIAIDLGAASLLAALGIAYDEDHTAVLAWPSQHAVVVVDLQAKTSRSLPWLPGAPGPADIAFR